MSGYARFDRLTRDELRDLAPAATVLVPLGATEQHGHHLPTGTDTAIVSALAEHAATLAAVEIPVVLAPALPFGFSHHHRPLGGAISIGLHTYGEVLADVAESLADVGFRRVFFLNGHGGNDAPIRAVGDRVLYERGLDVHVAATSYWICAAGALDAFRAEVGPVPGHAGSFETACLLALDDALVRHNRLPAPESEVQPLARDDVPGVVVRRPGLWEESDGRSDDADRASRELGDRALAAIARCVADALVAFHRSTPKGA